MKTNLYFALTLSLGLSPIPASGEDGVSAPDKVLEEGVSEARVIADVKEAVEALQEIHDSPGGDRMTKAVGNLVGLIHDLMVERDGFASAAFDALDLAEELADKQTPDMGNLTPVPGQTIENLELVNGTTYKTAVVKSIDAAAIVVQHEAGAARILIERLTPEWRERLGYDAAKANDAAMVHATNQAVIDAMRANEAALAGGSAPDVPDVKPADLPPVNPDSGINLYGIGAKVVEDEERSDYVHVAWKVSVLNHGENAVRNVTLSFIFLDRNDFEVDKEVDYGLNFAAGETRTLSGKRMMLRSVWEQVDGYSVRTR